MSVLCRQSIQKLIAEKQLVSNFIYLTEQLQQAGIDLTLEKVSDFNSIGTIDFDNSERKFPEFSELNFEKDFLQLKQGAYKIRFNEEIKIPSNCVGIGLPRSSLLRMGSTVETALWDPGFEGKGESLLLVQNPHGLRIKKNAKILQLFFMELDRESDKLYEGIHKNIKK